MVRLGIIGLGYWGSNGLRIFSENLNSDLLVCCDRDKKRIALAQLSYPKPEYTDDYSRVLAHPQVDAVVLATPAWTHFKIVKEALQHGKHVFVEKPLTLKAEESEELSRLAARLKRVLLVGHVYLFNSHIEALSAIINKNDFGKLFYIHSTRTGLGPVRSDASALWDLATHDVSILLKLIPQKPLKVVATGAAYLQKKVPDVVFLSIHFGNNIVANINVSWLDPLKVRRMTIVGSKKMVIFDENDPLEKIRVFQEDLSNLGVMPAFGESRFLKRLGDIYSPAVPVGEPLKKECEYFLKCVMEKKAAVISDGKFSVKVVRVLEAAQQSLESGGQPVRLK